MEVWMGMWGGADRERKHKERKRRMGGEQRVRQWKHNKIK